MDDFMLMEYFKNRDRNIGEKELISKFKEFMSKNERNHYIRHQDEKNYPMSDKIYDDFYARKYDYPNGFKRMLEDVNEEGMYESLADNEHFNDSYAKYIVSNMFHFDNGRKYIGEKFNMDKAKEICERYRGIIPHTVTYADIYVAINSQYHDYCKLFKSWFEDEVEQRVIESAIIFWFKDDDYKEGSKLWNYFKEN